MKKRFLKSVIATGIALSAFGGTALADDDKGFYVTLGIGTSGTTAGQVDLDETSYSQNYGGHLDLGSALQGEAGFGYDFGNTFRLEATYTGSKYSLDGLDIDSNNNNHALTTDGDLSVASWMINGYKDFPIGNKFKTYVGGGIGTALLDVDSFKLGGVELGENRDSFQAFTYRAKVGLSYPVTNSLDAFAEGNIQNIAKSKYEYVSFDAFTTWGAQAGVRYSF